MKKRGAFAVIELIITIVVIVVVALVFVPAVIKIQENARLGAIQKQLSSIVEGGKTYLQETELKMVDYNTLVKRNAVSPAESIMGESYDAIVINSTGGTISVTTSIGKKISVEY